ncbi:type III PLP-dependent enzyme domain-containing protein, partial [Lactobacillus taiwanensis]
IKIIYSVKANMNVPILRILGSNLDGFDCASIYEYNCANQVKSKDIYLTGMGFTGKDFKHTDLKKAKVDCSTIKQIEDLRKINRNLKIGIRIKGDAGLGVSIVNLKTNPNLLRNVIRFHFHGDSIKNIKLNLLTLSKLVKKNQIKLINFGGGGIAVRLLDCTDKEALELLNKSRELFPNAALMIEPGQLIVAAAGFLTANVIYADNKTAVLNSSSFNLSSWYIPKLLWPHLSNGKGKIIGNTNWNRDIFVKNVNIEKIHSNDVLIFGLVGAYYETTKRNLHGYPFPKEKYFKKGRIKNNERNAN